MTALELYNEDRQQRREPLKRRSRQEYFLLLRDTLHEELATEGRSEFLEEMIAQSSEKALGALEFAALRECFAAIVDGRRMKDASTHVPHILRGADQPLSWAELEGGPAFRVNDPQTAEMLIRLRNVSWQLVSARDQTPAVEAERAVNREIAGLKAVNHALESDNRALRAERDELRARIARLEEGVISRQLQNRVDARRYQLEGELKAEMEEKRRAAEGEMRQALAQAAEKEQQAREAARREAADADARRAGEYERLQAALQGALAQQLEGLQRALRGADCRFLAQCCATLWGTVTRQTTEVVGSAQAHGADEALLGRLAELSATLNAQLTRLEQALLQLGLQVYQPQPGEPYDSALHSPVSASGDDAPQGEREIAGVETPGVRLVHGNGEAEVLVRAVVRTRRRDAAKPAEQE